MEALDSEKEQLAQIKKWIQENGLSLVMGVVLGLGGVYGWRAWQDYRVTQSEQISAQLAQAVINIGSQQNEVGATLAERIAIDNNGTLYGDMARLLVARARVQQGVLEEAVTSLQAISDSSLLKNMANIRLARIYLAQARYDLARQLIPEKPPQAYESEYEELRGDIEYFSGNHADARAAYLQAIALASPADDLQFLQMKLDDLPVSGNKE